MKLLRRQTKIKRSNNAAIMHVLLVIAQPIIAYVLVRLGFAWFAVLLILFSKWRMFAVKARHWPANFRANTVDIFAGLAFVLFMVLVGTQLLQVVWVLLYIVWLLLIKPKSSPLWVGIQALIAQTLSLVVVFLYWAEASTLFLMFLVWGVAYLSSRHFFTAFDESMARSTAYLWAFFAASITWLSGHWLIFYGPIAQPALLLSVLGYGLSSIYYLQHKDRLTPNVRRQFVGVMAIVVLIVIIFSDWSDKTI